MSVAYEYRVLGPQGRSLNGTLVAASEPDARTTLRTRGYLILDLRPARRRGTLSRQDLAAMFRSIATLVESGTPLDRAIESTRHGHGKAVGLAAAALNDALANGVPLSVALAESGTVSSPVVIGMLAGREQSGQLAGGLGQAADYLEKQMQLRSRVRQQLAYPMVLVCAGGGSLLFILGFVVPRFAALLDDPRTLPATTQLLMAAGNHLGTLGVISMIAVAGILLAVSWMRSSQARPMVDRWLFHLPLVGSLRWSMASERFCRALGEMLQAGIPVLTALDRAASASDNHTVIERSWLARERIRAGSRLGAALAEEQVLPPGALQLVNLGDQSGRLAPMIIRAADQLAVDVERRLHTTISLVEPAVVIGFGAIVALVAASLLQAIYSLRPGL